ncbi:hypothetical protein C8F01DRAFT_1099495 [Mycena amicta]|nr:hypothetical protein C8F01DRAFT_1099495 [Mycena amicta]
MKRVGNERDRPSKRPKHDHTTLTDTNATTDDWFLTPHNHPSPAAWLLKKPTMMDVDEESDASPALGSPVATPTNQAPRKTRDQSENDAPSAQPHIKLSKGQKRRIKRQQRADRPSTEPTAPETVPIESKATTVTVPHPTVQSPVQKQLAPAPTSLVKPPNRYYSLDSLPQNARAFSVIGVVTMVTPVETTRTGDLTRHVRIVDPSNCTVSFAPTKEGLGVNFFSAKYSEWLPRVKVGSVVILRDIKLKPNSGLAAVGYKDQLSWAVYDSETGMIGHGDLGQAPKSEVVAGKPNVGPSRTFSPFYEASKEDLTYCIQLHDWWRGVQETRNKEGTVIQISNKTYSKRPHCNPAQTENDVQYFDWTAELLHGHANNDTYSLYLTDYSEIPQARPCIADWCAPSLRQSVLRVEMFDAAQKSGPTMVVGGFYRLKNVRKDFYYDNLLQGKIVEPKIVKLDQSDPCVVEMLQRKGVVALSKSEEPELAVKCINEIRVGSVDPFVVELLHVEHDAIFVADYTAHPQIPPVDKPWAKGLDRFVLKIVLFDKQKERAQSLAIGQHYVLNRVRFERNSRHHVSGRMEGADPLIHQINPHSGQYGHWREQVIQRKKKMGQGVSQQRKASLTMPVVAPAPTVVSPKPTISPPSQSDATHTINELHTATPSDLGPFFIRVRVVDFYPFHLSDSFKRVCTECRIQLPESQRKCEACEHNGKYTKIISILRILVKDEDGTELKLSISGHTTPFLKDQPAIILREDSAAAEAFSQRMQPLLGNLEVVHAQALAGQSLEPSGQPMTLMVDRWRNANGEWVYGLFDIAS